MNDCNYPLCMMGDTGCEKESICDKPDQEILIPQNEWFEKCKEVTKLKTENEKLKEPLRQIIDYGYSSVKFSTPDQLVDLLDCHIDIAKKALNEGEIALSGSTKKLKTQLEKAEAVIKFYGNNCFIIRAKGYQDWCRFDDLEKFPASQDEGEALKGGKRAREYFKEKEDK